MAYERSAIETNAPPQAAPQVQMREERVIDPYTSSATKLQKAMETVKARVTGQQPIIETKTAAETASPAESVTLSPQMAALARKEQKARQYEQSLKKRELELEAEKARLAGYAELDTKLTAGDYSVLESKVPYDKYTNYLIEKAGTLSPEAQAVKALEAKVDNLTKEQNSNLERMFEAAVSQRRSLVVDLLKTDPSFKRINKIKDGSEIVMKHIMDTYEHDGKELSPIDAAKEVEEFLTERAKQYAALLDEDQVAAAEPAQTPPLRQAVKTLTNNMTVSSDVKRPNKSFAGMSETERYAEARRRAEEKVKQKAVG